MLWTRTASSDEVRTLCGVFGGKTLSRPESIDTLKRLFQNATYRLTLDADSGLDGAVDALLKGLAGDKDIPVLTWVVPKQVLHRNLRVGFKRDLRPLLLESLRTYAGVLYVQSNTMFSVVSFVLEATSREVVTALKRI